MEAGSTSAASNQGLYIGLGCGIGGLLLATISFVCFLIVRKIRQHRKATSLLEQGQSSVTSAIEQRPSHDIREALGRRNSLLTTRPGWDALSSTDTIDQQLRGVIPPVRTSKKKKNKKIGIQLKRLKHLSAITESPRSRHGQSPAVPTIRTVNECPSPKLQQADFIVDDAEPIGCAQTADFPVQPGEGVSDEHINALGLKLLATPASSQIEEDKSKPPRSVSVGALLDSHSTTTPITPTTRPHMHVRSISLGGKPPEHLPPDPTPNLPVISPHNPDIGQRRCASHGSVSSQDSASSSVLINSPFATRTLRTAPVTPRGQRAITQHSAGARLPSIRTDLAIIHDDHVEVPLVSPLTDNGMELKRDLSSSSSISSLDDDPRTSSFRRVTNLNRPNKSSVSPAQSAKTTPPRRLSTARRASRSSVSATGSPTERKRPGVLRDISGNSLNSSRRLSTATSTNSSENNPFQWDNITSHKPSALKGSPYARKTHRRQNCVRISTLTPQVLGPPPARSTSPSISHRIIEESGDDAVGQTRDGTPFVTNRRPSRPLSGASAAPDLRIQTLRASLTPSSPTLSMWAAYQDHLSSQASDSHLTASSEGLSRSESNLSSACSIPAFPSPSKAMTSAVQLTQPTPVFCISQPSSGSRKTRSSPFDLHTSSSIVLSSSPPVLSPSTKLYDRAQPPMPQFDIESFQRYDQTSPFAPRRLFERTPPLADSTVILSDMSSSASTRRPEEDDLHQNGSTTSSPAPVFRERSQLRPISNEVLTSNNASSIMARMPTLAFPGAPVLSPPRDDNPIPPPLWVKGGSLLSRHDAAVPELSVSPPREEVFSSRVSGPRTEPPKSVLKNAMALRRMNSEVDTSRCRETRRYVQLGRENSPILPLYGSPDMSESSNDLFDFGFDTNRDLDAGSGALESLGIVAGSMFSREASSFYHDLSTITEVQQYIQDEGNTRKGGRKRHAVTMDTDDPWRDTVEAEKALHVGHIYDDRKDHQQDNTAGGAPQTSVHADPHRQPSIIGTPQSLYGADGFLRNDC